MLISYLIADFFNTKTASLIRFLFTIYIIIIICTYIKIVWMRNDIFVRPVVDFLRTSDTTISMRIFRLIITELTPASFFFG